jgi:hypothetical protein
MGKTKWLRSSFFYIILVIAVVALWFTFVNGDDQTQELTFTEVATQIESGSVARLVQQEDSSVVRVK